MQMSHIAPLSSPTFSWGMQRYFDYATLKEQKWCRWASGCHKRLHDNTMPCWKTDGSVCLTIPWNFSLDPWKFSLYNHDRFVAVLRFGRKRKYAQQMAKQVSIGVANGGRKLLFEQNPCKVNPVLLACKTNFSQKRSNGGRSFHSRRLAYILFCNARQLHVAVVTNERSKWEESVYSLLTRWWRDRCPCWNQQIIGSFLLMTVVASPSTRQNRLRWLYTERSIEKCSAVPREV